MTLRPLALAALLLLLAPAPGVAHAAETEPAPAPAAGSPAEDPSPAPPAVDGPDGTPEPLPETGPADVPTAAPEAGGPPAPGAGSPSPDDQPSPAADGHAAPEDAEGRAGGDRAEEVPHEADPGSPADRTADAAELPALERASFVGPGSAVAHHPGSGALLRHEPALREQLLPGRQPVSPGTLTRISLGTVTRVPAQDAAAGSSTTGWVAGLSAGGAAAAAVVLARRSRARRARS